jgi:ferritin-like protein
MKTKELQQKIVDNMRRWKKIEDASVASTGQIIAKTDNPIVRMVMEIIQRDSQMHHRIQEMVADSLEGKTYTLTPEDLASVWEMVEAHIQLEKDTIRIAEESLQQLKGKKMVVQEYLLQYLLLDEQKHESVLSQLATIKKGMYPYG